ncbi:MAG: tRNA (adenosine(37)-N6)-threonylcarbamoyltransferase complex ATPase subunit type 1 TsaE [Pseudomonadota bacterium]
MLSLKLPNDAATRAIGVAIAPILRRGDVLALYGGLGAGKTTLVRGLIQTLCGAGTEVPSPTYTLVQTYDAPAFGLWHFDLYRIETPHELEDLGWDDTAAGVAIIEWPAHAGPALPAWRLDIHLAPDGSGRRVTLEGHGEDWQGRLNDDSFRSTLARD